MDAFSANIVSGVVGGLVTAVLIAIAAYIWRDRFVPWFEDKIYSGIRVAGTWTIADLKSGDQPVEAAQIETLELEQKAAKISGRVILNAAKGSTGAAKTLKIEGKIQDRFILFLCVPGTRRSIGYQSFLGEVDGDGGSIVGQACYYDTADRKIESVSAVYRRSD